MTNITKHFKHVYRCGYCDLHYIMRDTEPRYYNYGIYGWNCDIYTYGSIAITTGYRNMRGDRIPDNILEEYTNNAKQIIEEYHNSSNYMTYEEYRKKMDINIDNFMDAIQKEEAQV